VFSLQKSPVLQLGSQLKPKLAWTWTPLGVPSCSSPQQPPCPSHHPAVTLHTGRQRMSELVVFWEKKRVNRTATTHQNCARDRLGPPRSRAANTSGQNHRMVWVGRDLTDHLVPTPCHEQGHLPPAQVAPSSLALNTSFARSPEAWEPDSLHEAPGVSAVGRCRSRSPLRHAARSSREQETRLQQPRPAAPAPALGLRAGPRLRQAHVEAGPSNTQD